MESKMNSRSKSRNSNSEYLFQRTCCCEKFCVEDTELADLYTDPENLEIKITLYTLDQAELRCPFCDAVEFDLVEVSDLKEVPEAWKWVCE